MSVFRLGATDSCCPVVSLDDLTRRSLSVRLAPLNSEQMCYESHCGELSQCMSESPTDAEESISARSKSELAKQTLASLLNPDCLIDGLAVLRVDEAAADEISKDQKFNEFVRREWSIGRMHVLLQEFQRCQKLLSIRDAAVADEMGVAPGAVSHWYCGRTGITTENWVILQRVFPEIVRQREVPPEHYLDLWGFIRVVGRLKEGIRKHQFAEYPTVMQFFYLWALFRNVSFERAVRSGQKSKIQLQQRRMIEFAMHASNIYSWQPLSSKAEVGSGSNGEHTSDAESGSPAAMWAAEERFDPQFTLTHFGLYFYCTITGIHHACWSAPIAP